VQYQRARLEYQYRKLEKLREGVYPETGGNIEFELFSFFEVCYHLKDWIKESSCDGSVEAFVSNSPALRISADICNRLKHKVLRDNKTKQAIENKRSNAPLGQFQINKVISVGPIGSTATAVIEGAVIETERGQECCFSLAKECMDEWNRYFRQCSENAPNKAN